MVELIGKKVGTTGFGLMGMLWTPKNCCHDVLIALQA